MFNLIRLPATLALFVVSFVPYSSASETAWFETDGGNVKVVLKPFSPGESTIQGLIDIDLLPGWKTYWRDPGSGGIPPSIDLINNDNISVQKIAFPAPVWIKSKYGDYAGYDAPVKIPFVLNVDAPLEEKTVQARILVGICSDICIPAFADLNLELTKATGSSREMIAVNAAFEALPTRPDTLGMDIRVTPGDGQILYVDVSGEAKLDQFFVSGSDGEQFDAPVIVSQSKENTRFSVSPLRPFKDGQMVTVMFTGVTDKGAFETAEEKQFPAP